LSTLKTAEQWSQIGFYPHHGICIPISALRTKKSCGIGEFIDLIPLIDWCKSLKFDCIQLLPINDSGDDPSPYNPISSIALDPIYLSLADLTDAGPLTVELEHFQPFTELDRVARDQVKHQKMQWLFQYYQLVFPSISNTVPYQSFVEENPWLQTYALFKAIKDEYGGKRWEDWPIEYQVPDLKYINEKQVAVNYHIFLQYLCFSQMRKVKAYATERKIFLKGDIPILLSPDSADVWAHRHLFRFDLVAGAPPDYYNANGQKWGFPLFNWDEIQKSGFSWWKQRLKTMENFFHIYRIDHVVGFFRIWGIPKDKKPTEGHYVPSDTSLWDHQGREILEMMIHSSQLLPIAEDLGTIPKGVRPILKELGICRTIVMRWERHWEGDKSFVPFSQYDPFSLTTMSTPDTEPFKLWWKKYPDEAIPFAHFRNWSYHPDLTPQQQFDIIRDAHHTPSYFHINILQEYLSLFPELVWPNLEDERFNVPGTLLPTNWTYRFRPYLEDLLAHQELRETIGKILEN